MTKPHVCVPDDIAQQAKRVEDAIAEEASDPAAGLAAIYRTMPAVKSFIHCLFAISFLPVHEVVHMYPSGYIYTL